jgi:hypothetical protein
VPIAETLGAALAIITGEARSRATPGARPQVVHVETRSDIGASLTRHEEPRDAGTRASAVMRHGSMRRALGAEVMAWVERPGGGRRVILHKRLVVRAGELHWDDVRGGDAS